MKVKDFSKIYFAFLLLHLVVIYKPDVMLYTISKPLLMVSLLLFYISKTEFLLQKTKWWISSALFFSLLGDTLLMRVEQEFFLLGMGAFTLAHLAYILFFYTRRSGPMNPTIVVLNSIFVIALLVGLNHFVSIPDLLFYPINIYGIIIGINLILSVQFSYANTFKSGIVPVGVFLFVMSDILLAIGKFQYNNTALQITVMLTYGVAQFLIVLGTLRYFQLNK